MDPDVDHWIGRTLDGRYTITGRLGAGNVGAVYDATHVELKRRVAIKVLHAELGNAEGFEARFVREARSVSRLNHPGCVALLDFGRVARIEPTEGEALIGTPYLVMEHVAGELLLDRIERGGILASEALAIVRGALAALRHAHGLQIVHRDIKPANIMLCGGGTEPLVKVLDFGLAKELNGGPEQAITQAGMVFGTPSYLSPEQGRGDAADARSDLYSLGVVLFELLAGRKPFDADSPMGMVKAHLVTPPPKLRSIVPTLSPALEAAVARALEKDANLRYATAAEMLAALEACPEAGGAKAAPIAVAAESARRSLDGAVGALGPALNWVRTHRVVVLGGAGIVALGLAAVLLWPRRAPAPVSFAPTTVTRELSPSAQRHLTLADDYQRKLWCSDTIDELGRALRDAPQLKDDPAVVRIAIPCLRNKTQARTIRFLSEQLGPAAVAPLSAALAAETRADLREGMERALAALNAPLPR